jgi:hypothetical protein
LKDESGNEESGNKKDKGKRIKDESGRGKRKAKAEGSRMKAETRKEEVISVFSFQLFIFHFSKDSYA